MATDVENHVLTCPCCQITAATNRAALPIQEVSPVTDLGAHWHLDLAGPFTAYDAVRDPGTGHPTRDNTSTNTDARQYYVFIAVEAVSRWTKLLVIPDKTANSTAQALYTSILSRYGNFRSLTSDNGDEWAGPFHRLLISLGIRHISTPHPDTRKATASLCPRYAKPSVPLRSFAGSNLARGCVPYQKYSTRSTCTVPELPVTNRTNSGTDANLIQSQDWSDTFRTIRRQASPTLSGTLDLFQTDRKTFMIKFNGKGNSLSSYKRTRVTARNRQYTAPVRYKTELV